MADALEERIVTEFANSPQQARFLFTCRFTKIMKLNFLILKTCLGRRSEKGVYVSIDRPYGFTMTALKRMNVPQDGIIYIDAITKLTGVNAEESQVKFLASGFSPKILSDLFSRAFTEGAQKHFVNLEDLNFILIDNVSIMLQYATMDRIKKMLTDLTELLRKFTAMRAVFIIDRDASPQIYALLKGLTDHEIPVMEDWL